MWGVLVALLLVSTAISEDVVSTTSVSPLDVKDTEKPIKASRRSSSDNVPDKPLLRALEISTPPALLQPPNHAEISLPDLSKYISPPVETAVPKSLNLGYNVQVQQQPTYAFNLPLNHVTDPSHYYSTQSSLPDLNGQITQSQNPGSVLLQQPTYDWNLPLNHAAAKNALLRPDLYDQILNSQSSKYNLLQSMLNYPINTQNPIHCQDHSDILYKLWLILSTLLESLGGTRIPHANQIKYALMLISKYLEQSNVGNPNDELKLKLMLLEAELEKERAMTNIQPHFNMWLNMIPGLSNNLPKLPLPYEALNSEPMLSKCKDAFTRLLQWTQASYENILKRPGCYSNYIDPPVNYGGSNAAFDVASNPYVRIPYSNYNHLNQYLHNSAPYTLGQVQGSYSSPLFNQLTQHMMDSPNLNTQRMTTYYPSLVSQPNQNQPNKAPNLFNDNSLPQMPQISLAINKMRASSYLPSSYLYESPAVKNIHRNTLTQITEPKKSYPATILQPSSIYQKERPLNSYIPVTRESVPSAQNPINGPQIPSSATDNFSPLALYNDFATNLQNVESLTNRIPADDVHQHNLYPGANVFNSGVLSPQNSGAAESFALVNSYKSPSSPPTLDQNAMRGFLQNLSLSQVYRDNIQNYLSSQNIPSSTNVPLQYGTYNYASYQSVPIINNAFPVVNQFKENVNIPAPNNLGINENLYQVPMPAQQYGTYSHYSYQRAPYINSASLPVTQFKENMYVPAANNMQGINQNLYPGTRPMDKASPTIDWYSIANSSKANPNYTPNGEVELTYAVRRPMPTENQPLYFIKYRIPYDVFMQNVRSLLSRRSDKPDLSKDLVLRSNASEIPKDLASFPKEEVTEMVVKDGDLIKARYIQTDDSENDTVSSAADSINALLNKTINMGSLDELNPGLTARNDLTRTQYEHANQYQYGVREPLMYQKTVNTNPNAYGMTYPSGVNPFQPGSNGLGLRQAAMPHPFNSELTRQHIKTKVQTPLEISRNF